MVKKFLKKSTFLALAFAVVLSLSCCGVGDEILIDEIPTETTSEAAEELTADETTYETTTEEMTDETTAQTLSEEELDELVQNMPEIVFVLSYQVYHENIFGYYVKNTGEVKMFDFREIAPDEIYDIPDVYGRLEEVTYDGLYIRKNGKAFEKIISEDNLKSLSEDELIGYYKQLLLIEGDAKYFERSICNDSGAGEYKLYGIKKNHNGEKKCILLWGGGSESDYKHSDPDAKKIYSELVTYEFFPALHYELWW